MKLSSANINTTYRISSVDEDCENKSRLINLGIIEGQLVKCLRKAPFFGNPILFEVGESQIMLSKSEASKLNVSEVSVEQD